MDDKEQERFERQRARFIERAQMAAFGRWMAGRYWTPAEQAVIDKRPTPPVTLLKRD
jgi:hypothetical protein